MSDIIASLPRIPDETRQELIKIFNNSSKLDLKARVFVTDITSAVELVAPIINSVLGEGNWTVSGGNFFESEVGYRIHADTGKDNFGQLLQTFVFPLSYELTDAAQLEKNRLIILKQRWHSPAAFFMQGSQAEPNEYNDVVRDYKDVIGYEPGKIDHTLMALCPHLPVTNLLGFTVDKTMLWEPGVPITFPRDRIHASSAFHKFGIKKKLGLSVFTSHPSQ
jgi:hypothetical protein